MAAAVADASLQLFVKRFYIDAELQSLGRLPPVLDAIEVNVPHLGLTHQGCGDYHMDDSLERFNKSADQPDCALLPFALYNLALSGAQWISPIGWLARRTRCGAANHGLFCE